MTRLTRNGTDDFAPRDLGPEFRRSPSEGGRRNLRVPIVLLALVTLAALVACRPLPTRIVDAAAADPAAGSPSLDGIWRWMSHPGDERTGTIWIDGDTFRAEGFSGDYAGTITVRPDASPATIDFAIVTCGCDHEGKTSTGIYYVDEDGSIVFAGPVPGEPRPLDFTDENLLNRMRRIDPDTYDDHERWPI